jgi:glycosyltransferase involved in cell wall biosynthesis
LFVIDNLGSGGAQRQMATLAATISHRGHHVELFTYSPHDFFAPLVRAAGVPIHCHPKPWRFSCRPVAALRRLVRQGFDVVLAFMPVPSLYALVATRGVRPAPAVIVSERVIPDLHTRLVRPLHRWADHVVTNSFHAAELYRRSCPRRAGRVSAIWNGVDLATFRPQPMPPRPTAGGVLRLLGVGRIIRYKNWHCLVEALAIARREHGLSVQVSIAGRVDSCSRERDRYQRELVASLARHGLQEHWSWLGERSDVPALLAEHHALVHPSYCEGLPNTVCEALASGRPVLASNTLDHPRLVQHGRTGLLFDWQSPADLAQAMATLAARDDAALAAMGLAARQFAEEHLSMQRMADQYEELFFQLTAARTAAVATQPRAPSPV